VFLIKQLTFRIRSNNDCLWQRQYYRLCLKKFHPFYFLNNSVKKHQISMIFSVHDPQGTWHQKVVKIPTSPIYCGCITLKSAKESYFNNVIHTYFRIISLSLNKTDYNSLNEAVTQWVYVANVARDLPLHEHTYRVYCATVWSPHPLYALLDSTPCPNQPLPQLDHIPGYMHLHHAPDAKIHRI